eukprot:668797-Pyramimonas_sp.AAC.1
MELPPHRDRPAFPWAATNCRGAPCQRQASHLHHRFSQGGEADLVIYLTARSNSWHDWGFMDNPNRVNVAITRATTNV